MKKSNKKGFTIVELVIVIAVIAILAAVLIPTFSNVVTNAKKSAAMQNARNAYEEYLAENADEVDLNTLNLCIKSGTRYYIVTAGQFNEKSGQSCDSTKTACTVNGELLTINESGHTHA